MPGEQTSEKHLSEKASVAAVRYGVVGDGRLLLDQATRDKVDLQKKGTLTIERGGASFGETF
jgi:hypothetical protein